MQKTHSTVESVPSPLPKLPRASLRPFPLLVRPATQASEFKIAVVSNFAYCYGEDFERQWSFCYLSVGDFSVRWRELRLGLSRIQSANFQWWQFGSPREPTRENTDRLTVGECVNVGRFSLIYNFSDLRRLIHTTRFELVEYRFLEPSIFRTNFRFP